MAIFQNQATLSYNGSIINSNTTTGQLVDVLSATKSAVSETYSPGETVSYVISVVNSGTTAFSSLTVTDDLGRYTYESAELVPLTYVDGSVKLYVNGVLQSAPTVSTDSGLSFSGISIPAGGNAVIIYEATANQFASPETSGSITNQATITGTGSDITVSDTVTASSSAQLSITKALCPDTVSENGTLNYTFIIQNSGNEAITADSGVIVSDVFDPILSDIAATFNGDSWAEGTNYTYSETTGSFETLEGQITVPAATYTRDTLTGAWITTPGVSALTISGTV